MRKQWQEDNLKFIIHTLPESESHLFLCSLFICATRTSCGGGGAKVESTMSTQTLGQQLIDLDKAYKEGVISEKEYKKSKESLIKNYK